MYFPQHYVILQHLFYFIIAHKAEYGISGFGVSITTMEEVFIKVGHGMDETLEGRLINVNISICLQSYCVYCQN